MDISKVEYVPGRCNIGPDEIRLRNRTGWMGLGVTAVLWVVLALVRVAPPWMLFLFLPSAMAAAGFLQGAFRFCAGFGMRGVFNFGSVGTTETVEQAEFRRKDQARGRLIMVLSFLAGAVVAAVGVITAR
ncbi:MAG TPA: hypothetical protein VMV68_05525 [Spirochaetia bacterium]|nr:hypothetical protein [Spirochaetia bacterium]